LRAFEPGGTGHLELGGGSLVFSVEGGGLAVPVVGLAQHLARLPDLVLAHLGYLQAVHWRFRRFEDLYAVQQLVLHPLFYRAYTLLHHSRTDRNVAVYAAVDKPLLFAECKSRALKRNTTWR
jgi:hypothetical protein